MYQELIIYRFNLARAEMGTGPKLKTTFKFGLTPAPLRLFKGRLFIFYHHLN